MTQACLSITGLVNISSATDLRLSLFSRSSMLLGTGELDKSKHINEPRREKTGLRGFRLGPTQTGMYSHRRWLEAGNFGFRK